MTGGMAFVYDPAEALPKRINPESVIWQRIEMPFWENVCRQLVEAHVESTQSRWAAGLLNDWDRELAKFWQIVPKEMIGRLVEPTTREALAEARA